MKYTEKKVKFIDMYLQNVVVEMQDNPADEFKGIDTFYLGLQTGGKTSVSFLPHFAHSLVLSMLKKCSQSA